MQLGKGARNGPVPAVHYPLSMLLVLGGAAEKALIDAAKLISPPLEFSLILPLRFFVINLYTPPPHKTFFKRTILITGCSDGSLGAALALQFHKAGWRVFASAKNPAKLKQSVAAGIETVLLDTLSDDSIEACVSEVTKLTEGSLDALINNAGGGYSMPLMNIEIQKARDLFELSVWSLITVTRAFLPLLMKSTHAEGALLINIPR
ncbi:hypothetical protein BDW74DRAFT_183306 [Aspergillus multicolor]|uniref:uncharacterized protein n=1 Tax=Aspergillus multicolor TaxID=41759 RepID=UPI003CCC95C9